MAQRFDAETKGAPMQVVVPKPGRWNRPPQPQSDLALKVVFLASLLLGALCILVWGSDWLFVVPSFALVASLTVSFGPGWKDVPTRKDLLLFENPDDSEVCLVEIRIMRDGLTRHRDRGVAWFEDGRLLYQGHCTSFAIGGEDVLPQKDWAEFSREGNHGLIVPSVLPLHVRDAFHAIGFEPLRRKGTMGEMQKDLFHYRFAEFRLHPPRSSGPRQLPPFE